LTEVKHYKFQLNWIQIWTFSLSKNMSILFKWLLRYSCFCQLMAFRKNIFFIFSKKWYKMGIISPTTLINPNLKVFDLHLWLTIYKNGPTCISNLFPIIFICSCSFKVPIIYKVINDMWHMSENKNPYKFTSMLLDFFFIDLIQW
jgi:hypothetical protein